MSQGKENSFWQIIIFLYLIIWQIMSFYYWYEYTRTHSFWDGVFWGFFSSELKGLFWIINIW